MPGCKPRKLSDWFPPIFGWADKQPTETRNTIVGVMTTDPRHGFRGI